MKITSIILSLLITATAFSRTPTFTEDELTPIEVIKNNPDGTRNYRIGRMIYSNINPSNPADQLMLKKEQRSMTRLLWQMDNPPPIPDLTQQSTAELIDYLILATHGTLRVKATEKELARRPDEYKKLVREMMAGSLQTSPDARPTPGGVTLYTWSSLPRSVRFSDKDFQYEILKMAIFHPDIHKLDPVLIHHQDSLLELVKDEQIPEMARRLQQDGRLPKLLKFNARVEKIKLSNPSIFDKSVEVKSKPETNPDKIEPKTNNLGTYLLYATIMVIIVIIFILAIRKK